MVTNVLMWVIFCLDFDRNTFFLRLFTGRLIEYCKLIFVMIRNPLHFRLVYAKSISCAEKRLFLSTQKTNETSSSSSLIDLIYSNRKTKNSSSLSSSSSSSAGEVRNDISARIRANVKGKYKSWNANNPLPYRVWRVGDEEFKKWNKDFHALSFAFREESVS